MKLYQSRGVLRYERCNGFRLTVEVDRELARYYYSMIPKYYSTNRPRWGAHVTVVRPGLEVPVNMKPWGKYEGETIHFQYDPYIHEGREYYWLNVLSNRLETIRFELGLSIVSKYTLPPEGFSKYFHCTIANTKNL